MPHPESGSEPAIEQPTLGVIRIDANPVASGDGSDLGIMIRVAIGLQAHFGHDCIKMRPECSAGFDICRRTICRGAANRPSRKDSTRRERSRPWRPPMPSQELTAALAAARAAADVIGEYYGKNPSVRTKPDDSPVTEADVRAEEVIRATLSRQFPGYGFYGEETGQHAMQAENLWLVDPIDGTRSFVRDTPFFSTQIALLRAGQLVLGVSNAPAYGELAWAEQGAGAWLNERAVGGRGVAALAGPVVSTGNLKTLARSPRWQRLAGLIGRVSRVRGY